MGINIAVFSDRSGADLGQHLAVFGHSLAKILQDGHFKYTSCHGKGWVWTATLGQPFFAVSAVDVLQQSTVGSHGLLDLLLCGFVHVLYTSGHRKNRWRKWNARQRTFCGNGII